MDLVTVIPEEGYAAVIARKLLAVADHPYDVQVVTNPQFGFRVPVDLLERFEWPQEPDGFEPEPPKEPKTFVDGDTDLAALKKRGRPRKSSPAKAVEGEEK